MRGLLAQFDYGEDGVADAESDHSLEALGSGMAVTQPGVLPSDWNQHRAPNYFNRFSYSLPSNGFGNQMNPTPYPMPPITPLQPYTQRLHLQNGILGAATVENTMPAPRRSLTNVATPGQASTSRRGSIGPTGANMGMTVAPNQPFPITYLSPMTQEALRNNTLSHRTNTTTHNAAPMHGNLQYQVLERSTSKGPRESDSPSPGDEVQKDGSNSQPHSEDRESEDPTETAERDETQEAVHTVSSNDAAPSTSAVLPNAIFSTTITNFEEARGQLLKPGTTYYRLNIKNDNVDDVEGRIAELAKVIFDNLLLLPKPSDDLDDEQKKLHTKRQETHLKKCQNKMTTEEDCEDASARCLLAVEAALRLHKKGIPKNKLMQGVKEQGSAADHNNNNNTTNTSGKKIVKTRTSYIVDTSTKCKERVEKIADLVKDNKLIAADLLTSLDKLDDISIAVDHYLGRKESNIRGNAKKADQLKDGKKVKQQGKSQPTVGAGGVKGTRVQGDDEVTPATQLPTGLHSASESKPKAKKRKHSSAAGDVAEDVVENGSLPPSKSTRARTSRQAADGAQEE